MKPIPNVIFRGALTSALLGFFTLTATAQTLPSQSTILATANKVADFWIANDPWLPGVANHTWTGSTLMNGYLALYQVGGNQKYFNYASSWASHYTYTLDGTDKDTFCDHYACGETFIILYKLTGSSDSTKIQHIKSDIDYQNGLGSAGYKFWGFVDALNQGGPSFASLSVIENNPAISAHMYQMYLHVKTTANSGLNLWNTTDHLWYRDTTQKSPKQYWSRGDGWAVLMHAKMLQTLPVTDPHYAEYLSTFQQQMAALLPIQRSDGLWNVDLANANNFPGPETSGSACFMYGLAYGIRTGILDSATYMPALVKAWNGFANVAIHPDNGMLGYIQGTGSSPSSRQPVNYNNTNVNHTGGDNRNGDFAYGLFLLAAAEVSKIAPTGGNQVAAPSFSPAAGTYTSAQNVTITTSTGGASIRYTTDGSTPSATAGTIYSGPVNISSSPTILNAIAFEAGFAASTVTSATYTIGGPPPTFNFEAESLSPVGSGAPVSISNDANASGGVIEFLNSTAAGQTMTFTTPNMPAGTYQVQLRYKTNKTRGQHTLTVDGIQVGGTLDQYATTSTYLTSTFGNVTLSSSGAHTIVMTVTGKNSAATAFYITADKFTFVGQ